MADQTRKAVIDALHRAYMDHEDFKMTTDLLESLADAAIATLHHAEAGAVEPFGYIDAEEMARHKREGAGGGIVCGNYSERYGRTTPLFLHPAQPASQQGVSGEVMAALCSYQQADPDGVMVLVSRQALDLVIAALSPSVDAPPHPTGDKVRGLLEKWRADAHASGSEWDEGYNTGRNCCADELTAALDQEKGNGRS